MSAVEETRDGRPRCPFCDEVMTESDDHTRMVCEHCDCDVLLGGGPR